jgi:carboxypeptidase family protein
MKSQHFEMKCLLPILFVFLQCSAFAESEHHGQIAIAGVPVPGVTVTAMRGDKKIVAVTDPQGAYFFPDLEDGSWTIEVEMLGFTPAMREIIIMPDAPTLEWELKMLAFDEIHAEVIRTPTQRTQVNASKGAAAAAPTNEPPASGAFANLSQDDLNQRAADGLLINGSVNNGAASPFAQLPGFGNNRNGGRSLYTGGIGIALDSSALDARSYSLTGQDTGKPSYNRFLGTFNFGGPLRIPHLIRNGPTFFFGYQRTQNRNATIATGRMPTASERSGNLSPTLQIPADRISRQAQALLSLYPLPNFFGSTAYNYQIPVVGTTHQDNVQLRLNKNLNFRNQFGGFLDTQSTRTDSANIFGFLDSTATLGINVGMNWTYRSSPRSATTFRYQFSRQRTRVTPYFANQLNVSGIAGISGNNQDPLNWGPPSLVFSRGMTNLSSVQYSFNRNQTNSVSYSTFMNRGRHNLTFGAELRKLQINLLSQQDPRGTFTFTGTGTGSDFANFLLGIPDASSIAFGNADKYLRQPFYDAFFTDDWRINGGLTINAGLRWEYEAPMTELYDRLVNLDIAPGFAAATPLVGATLHPDRTGIQPRVGFAWRPVAASSMIVRGGYGIYRNTTVYPPIMGQMTQQSPLSKSVSIQNSAATPLTLANGFPGGLSRTTFAADPNFRVGYVQNWQLSVQRDLPAALQMTATYLGSKGMRLPQEFVPNTFPDGAPGCRSCPTGFIYAASNGNSSRQAAQVQLRRRLRDGFTANIQYTLAKATDDAPLMAGLTGGANGNGPNAGGNIQTGSVIAQNWLDLKAERGRSNFDQRHQVTVETQYTSGVGLRGGALVGGWKGALLKEWTITGQLTTGSGLPLTPTYLVPVTETGITGTLRPDVTGAPLYAAPAGLSLNPAAYRPPASGQWGNARRNSITGPSQFSLNASLGRTFRWGDRFNIDLRTEATNVLNHVTFPTWNTIIGNAQFGLPTRANAMRSLQTTLRLRF